MASGPIKFRCGQCKQLIGVARSKAGTVISCPRCDARLVAPEPDDGPADVVSSPPPSSSLSPLAPPPSPQGPPLLPPATEVGSETGVSLESLDIRVEDIRVEPAVRALYPAMPPSRPERLVEPAPEPVHDEPVAPPSPQPAPPLVQPDPPPVAAPPVVATESPVVAAERVPVAPASAPAPAPAVERGFPEIRLEPPEPVARHRRAELARPFDLVLPRAVVASWSLLVLLAITFAFIAGLLAGHYVWQVH
jgi:DNA-directed RNA polymerase subunit RPC12/RpoP